MRQQHAEAGNAAVIVFGITLLISLTLVGISLSNLSYEEAKRTISTQESLQLYYVAQAGIQDALATRLGIRSNRRAFIAEPLPDVGALANSQEPRYRHSGRVTTDDGSGTESLVGMYRFIVLGGDPSRNEASGQYLSTPGDYSQLSSPAGIPQNFYVISRGSICESNNGGQALFNALDVSNFSPVCSQGQLREMTLYSEMVMEDPGGLPNQVIESRMLPPGTVNVALPTPVQTANSGITNTVNFEAEWLSPNSVAQLERVLFHPISGVGGGFPERDIITIPGPGTHAGPTDIEAGEAIRLYFRGAIDDLSVYNYDPEACQTTNKESCLIRVEQLDAAGDVVDVYGGGSLMVPPPFTQVLIFPPPDLSAGFSSGTDYRLVVDGALADHNGNQPGADTVLTFTVGGP